MPEGSKGISSTRLSVWLDLQQKVVLRHRKLIGIILQYVEERGAGRLLVPPEFDE